MRARRNGQLEFANALEVPVAMPEAQPFLKWVGGKAQLLKQFDRLFPHQIDRYFEPFIGGGAVFFHLKHRFPRMRARLCDINDELINTYQAVRDFPSELMQRLDEHLTQYNRDRERYYYLVRSQHHLPRNEIVERAARMIFLNKTCFNGLWRVNARGEFNVPIGSHKNPALYDRTNILAASAALHGVELTTRDFRDTLMETQAGDFVYVDPPYVPVSLTANFTSYAKEDFGVAEQQELSAQVAAAARRGARLMLSNSDVPFVRNLYRGFTIHTVSARRAINRDGAKRGAVNEVLVCAGD
ncbi:MAG: DNA adenine methylase [Opitutaceae bacterium]|nr:DNA adenine methylase [Opitutaceae bacterium]